MDSNDEDWECPLCMEEIDISDRNFKPCSCGYQICRFCWHHIKSNLNGLCPACRRPYSDQPTGFKPISQEEVAKMRSEKRRQDREKREQELSQRRHLNNMRVVQASLVYVIGLPPRLANEEILRQHDYFGQYGKIVKIVINRRHTSGMGVYITYARKEDASKAIAAVDSTLCDGRIVRASNGTTKYCAYYLRGQNCTNPNCMYLHEPGDDAQSYTKEELIGRSVAHVVSSTTRPANSPVTTFERANMKDADGVSGKDASPEESALPPTASWAKPQRSSSSSSNLSSDDPKSSGINDTSASSPPPGLVSQSNDRNPGSAIADLGVVNAPTDSLSGSGGEKDAASYLKSFLEQNSTFITPLQYGLTLMPRYCGPLDPFDEDPLSVLARLPLSLLDGSVNAAASSDGAHQKDANSGASANRARFNDPSLRNYLYNANVLFGKPLENILSPPVSGTEFSPSDGAQQSQQQQNALLQNLVRAQQQQHGSGSVSSGMNGWPQWVRSGNPSNQSITQRVMGQPASGNPGGPLDSFAANFGAYGDAQNLLNGRAGKHVSSSKGNENTDPTLSMYNSAK